MNVSIHRDHEPAANAFERYTFVVIIIGDSNSYYCVCIQRLELTMVAVFQEKKNRERETTKSVARQRERIFERYIFAAKDSI